MRNENLLPFSSRNIKLNKKQIIKASYVSKLILKLFKTMKKNFKNKDKIHDFQNLIRAKNIKLEYLEIRNKNNLSLKFNQKNFKIFVAYYIKNVRLIDNI